MHRYNQLHMQGHGLHSPGSHPPGLASPPYHPGHPPGLPPGHHPALPPHPPSQLQPALPFSPQHPLGAIAAQGFGPEARAWSSPGALLGAGGQPHLLPLPPPPPPDPPPRHTFHSYSPHSSSHTDSKPEFLANIFDDVPEFAAMVPSPPPLPLDFHINSLPAPNRMLFNFGQFNQKMPHALAPGVAARELSDREVLDLAEQHVVYDHTDDGELMQMLFGMADEVPTMATIHLHTWHNVDNEQEEGLAGGVGQVAGEVQEQAEGSSGPEGLGSQLGGFAFSGASGQQGPGRPAGGQEQGSGARQMGGMPPTPPPPPGSQAPPRHHHPLHMSPLQPPPPPAAAGAQLKQGQLGLQGQGWQQGQQGWQQGQGRHQGLYAHVCYDHPQGFETMGLAGQADSQQHGGPSGATPACHRPHMHKWGWAAGRWAPPAAAGQQDPP
ncbi:hypothetical protein V8C86DRAFT_1469026 [Haematococcus lacustris]